MRGKEFRLPARSGKLLNEIAQAARKRGLAIYLVGGCVRDWLLNVETKDLDLVSESDPGALARALAKKWGGKLESFDRFGTYRLHEAKGFRLDFVRARAESYREPAALPDVRPGTLTDDLARRDFTINAIAVPLEGRTKLIDPFRGAEDLKAGIVRVLHDESFKDDPTRMFRAARFACRFGFELDDRTELLRQKAMSERWVDKLSRERLRQELVRILEEKDPRCALAKLKDWGLASSLHPELKWDGAIASARAAWERLGLMALGMDDGAGFIRSLNLERPVAQAIQAALELARVKESPRTAVDPLTAAVLRRAFAHVPKNAFAPLLVSGADLKTLGIKPGPEFKDLLSRAAKAQWAGDFSTRAGALRWLKGLLG